MIWLHTMSQTKAMISLGNLDKNIKEIKKQLNTDTHLMAVIKADAYGHGAIRVARQALDSGATFLGVAIPEEGVRLRNSGVLAPIIVLGGISEDKVPLVVDNDLTQCFFTASILDHLENRAKEKNKKVKLHLKLDTGMRRLGIISVEDMIDVLVHLKSKTNLVLEGVFTHFASADETDRTFTLHQLERFKHMLGELKKLGYQPSLFHAANSAAILDYPDSHFNLVRAGISLYGYSPSPCSKKHNVSLLPVLQWETKISCVKSIEAGDTISYGRTFTARKPMKIAVLPVGYADGYKRCLSNKGLVLVNGEKAPIVGRVCMDQCMVDVTHIPNVKPNDTVVLLGKMGNSCVDADMIADLCGTISYEILTSIGQRVERVYV